ncbi:hypothetical protein [Capnocytophaga sp.]|uniref:DUF7638 domain-containing protein n=1 Tax=Capnocytophaga sp. TaxID=44737 RepID=UPI0026DC9FC6|nr:hypothetical protein [Capnocytophaga sp.]MDO5105257.1 hypothetical protein [Capnocytophaga sp.]
MHFKPSNRVYKTQEIQGVSVAAFIENGGYHFTDLDIYENGRVYCWNFHDFEIFKQEVNDEWVVLEVPEGEDIRIFDLGSWKIKNPQWIFTKKTFIAYVESLIREMNPQWTNIYTYTEKKINGITIGEHGEGTVFKEVTGTNGFRSQKINANSFNLFYEESGVYNLVKIIVFADYTLQITRLENPLEISFDEFKKLIKTKKLVTNPPKNAQVTIYGLGSFTIDEENWSGNIKEKLGETEEIFRKLNNEPTLFELCKKAFTDFKENPTTANQEKLRLAYEQVPEHQRKYLGDMDTKDTEIRMIIYGKQEIENWSHYQIAKKLGEPLPNIEIPPITDDEA